MIMLDSAGWETEDIVYTDRNSAKGSNIVDAKIAPPDALIAEEANGLYYDMSILSMGPVSEQRLRDSVIESERPSGDQRATACVSRTQIDASRKRKRTGGGRGSNITTKQPNQSLD